LPILVSTRQKHRSRSSTIRAVVIYSPTRPCPSNTTPPVRSCCGNESFPFALPEPTGGRPLGTAAGVSRREPQNGARQRPCAILGVPVPPEDPSSGEQRTLALRRGCRILKLSGASCAQHDRGSRRGASPLPGWTLTCLHCVNPVSQSAAVTSGWKRL
jgi:hypothetical protein